MKKQQAQSFFHLAVNFIKSKGLEDEFVDFAPKADKEDIREFIETGEILGD
jgi:hypothetical protein